MPLIPIKLPAGIYRTGTDLDGTGRWIEANLVRWQNGSLRPIGGWGERDDISASLTAKPRAAHAWIDNTLGANQAYGSANELIYVNESGITADITPTGFITGNEDAAINIGFGGGFYGSGAWSYRRESADNFQEADTWSLDNWGEYLIGCCTSDGKLYEWTLNTSNPAAQIANSPEDCKGLIATEERFIFALQADGNPRKIAWCDREDNTTWAPLATNEAGDIELQTNGEIMCGLRMRGRTLIITNVDAHIASYQGAPYVYGFERVGTACGVVARKAAVAVDQGAFWMGAEGFFFYDGSVAKNLPCEVWDGVFQDINENQISKTFAVHNSEHGEVWWFYPSAGTTDNDSYVAYDYIQGHWSLGKINRTCGFDKGVFPKPTWIGTDRKTYTHELHGAGHGTYTPYAESSPVQLGSGDQVMKVNQLISDEATNSEVKVQFKTKFYPNDTEYVYPSASTYYTLGNQPTAVRFTGRSIAMRIEANSDNDWRVGTMRINAETGGKR